ncbi:WXG100 family type VII secretion target [Occultella kanbiaonis]|uniref:WXG100 family type VII secretion target n=1 Tax=Occultella kanbiaonis TaxID=2675754 RepID=UPI0012B8C9F7|nr:WXG100 family type VII secretion target [Occultella kanbiaonis]
MTFKANFEGIATAGADIVGGANKIEQQLADMDSQLQPLRADWTGAAAESYQTAKSQWSTAITDMKALLTEIGTAVGQGGQDYQSTENQNAARFQ